jgi:hypothetical protein
MPCRGSRRVAGLDCLLWDAWPSHRVVWACLSLPEYLPILPRPSLSLGLCASYRVLECLGLSLACDVKALVREGYLHGHQLLFPCDVEICSSTRVGGDARAVRLAPRTSRSRTCHARRRLVVRGGDEFL